MTGIAIRQFPKQLLAGVQAADFLSSSLYLEFVVACFIINHLVPGIASRWFTKQLEPSLNLNRATPERN